MQGIGLDQAGLEASARWYIGRCLVVDQDFLDNCVEPDKKKSIPLSGTYVYSLQISGKVFICFVFGAYGTWIADQPLAKCVTVNSTEAEVDKAAKFITAIDPENKYKLFAREFHLDLHAARLVRRPTDRELAMLQMQYRDRKRKSSYSDQQTITPTADGRVKRSFQAALRRRKREPLSEDERVEREIRALDRRRFSDGGILPPKERAEERGYVSLISAGPRRLRNYDRDKLDGNRSDTSEEEPTPWNFDPETEPSPPTKRSLPGTSLLSQALTDMQEGFQQERRRRSALEGRAGQQT